MPRIRKEAVELARTTPFWKIGLYIRLSKEDGKEDESASIINQEKILRAFVADYFAAGTGSIVNIFTDDGLTGTDTLRPGFRRLQNSIIHQEINCVIIKSLARGFRNLADQQKFLEEFIPSHGARFINIAHPFIDTFTDPRSANGLEIPIRGMFNEQFAATTSEEVRKTFKMKRERGEFIGAFAPYGYAKAPDNKNRLIIDHEAAEVVRSIFHWFVNEGYSKRGIADRLNRRGELNPESYKKSKGMKYHNPHSYHNDGYWSASTIGGLLANAVYTGAMVQGKTRIISYKVHKPINVPRKEWSFVPDTHEAIIDQITFNRAQELHRRDTRAAPGKSTVTLLAGLIRCADCKKAMHRRTARNISYYYCRSYTDKKSCTKHTIRQDHLEKVILTTLQMQIRLAADHPKLIGRINQLPLLNRENIRQAQALSSMEELLRQQKDISDGLYMDWKKGEIGREQYLRLKEKAVKQIQHCEINIAQLNDEIANLSGGETGEAPADNNSYLNHFLCNGNIEKLSRGLVVALIDTIWVHEKGEIAIDANFADQYIPFG